MKLSRATKKVAKFIGEAFFIVWGLFYILIHGEPE